MCHVDSIVSDSANFGIVSFIGSQGFVAQMVSLIGLLMKK
jgi:hypothetical protein